MRTLWEWYNIIGLKAAFVLKWKHVHMHGTVLIPVIHQLQRGLAQGIESCMNLSCNLCVESLE